MRCSTRSPATRIRFSRSTASRFSCSTRTASSRRRSRATNAAATRTRAVPQSIARTALNDKVAILSDNAGEDTRFGGQSILMQQIRSAICVPLIGSEDQRARHSLRRQRRRRPTASATRTSSSASRSPASRPSPSRTASSRSAFSASCSCAATSSASSRRSSPSASPSRRRRSSSAATSAPWPCCSATSAASRRSRRRCAPTRWPALLTEYFTEMVDCVFRHGGTLDKFIGDAVMAQWGAPIGGPDDADNAMAAALDMMRALDELNASWRAAGRPELQIGIGLNFGEAFAGNIGSDRRLEFTVIGDTVNTANRLCAAAGPREILLSEEFRARADSAAATGRVPADGAQEQEPAGHGVSRRAQLMRVRDAAPPGFARFIGRRVGRRVSRDHSSEADPRRAVARDAVRVRGRASACARHAPDAASSSPCRFRPRRRARRRAAQPSRRHVRAADRRSVSRPGRAPLELAISERLHAAGVPTPAIVAFVVYHAPLGFCRERRRDARGADSSDLSDALMSDDAAARDRAWRRRADSWWP